MPTLVLVLEAGMSMLTGGGGGGEGCRFTGMLITIQQDGV
jgi:hypothetical protein